MHRSIFFFCWLMISCLEVIADYHHESQQTFVTSDEYGNETAYDYDSLGRLIRIQMPAVLDACDCAYRPTTTLTYDHDGQVVQIENPNGAKTSIRQNDRGQPCEIHYPDGSHESFSYDLDGSLKEKAMRDRNSISFMRDNAGRVVRLEKRSPSGRVVQALDYTYQDGLVRTVCDGKDMKVRFLYDENGLQKEVAQETSDGVRHLEWGNDENGQKQQTPNWLSPEAYCLALQQISGSPFAPYPAADNSDSVFKQTATDQNALGQTVRKEEQVDGFGVRSILSYDALQRLESLIKINSLGSKIADSSYRYDGSGNLILERHKVMAKGSSTREFIIRRQYDPCNRLVSIAEGEAEQCKTTRYRYLPDGKLRQIIKPDGMSIDYVYNEEGLLHECKASNGSFDYVFEYDQFQQVVLVRDCSRGTFQKRHYNAFRELIGEQQSANVKVGYRYDSEGRQSGLVLPDDSQISYHYHGAGLSLIERLGKDQTSQYTHVCEHDEQGRLKTHRLIKGLGAIHLHYDSKERLAEVTSPWWSQKVGCRDIDPYGRVLAMSVQDVRGSISSQFAYTDEGQLAEEEGHQYAYDSLYNRIGDRGEEWEVNSRNQLVHAAEIAYVYDPNGNTTEKHSNSGSVFYSYDPLDRLVRVEYPRESAQTYVYDAFHRRIQQQEWEWQGGQNAWILKKTENLVYDGFKEIGKTDEAGKLVELRILGKGHGAEIGAAIALELDGRLFAPIHDIQGSVRCLVDASTGKAVESYSYTAFGEESIWDENGNVLQHSLVGNPWRFCSKRRNDLTGLIFFGKREYDPRLGRWMTPDPLFFYDTPNLYAFARNDPLNCRDLYGLFSISNFWDHLINTLYAGFQYLQVSAHQTRMKLGVELKLPAPVSDAFEKIGKTLFGESTYLLMGPHFEETNIDSYGQREVSDKVRVTFINGILNTRTLLKETLEMVSNYHGGVKVHYVFRPTEGWTWDISRGIMIKTAYMLGFRSLHSHLLAQLWRVLIQEMGGIEGGGTIVHYAHSLGGSDTDRARELLSPEEQKMIRVITFGTATLIRNEGYQSVINHISVNDGVSSFFLEPLGHIRNYFDPDSNVRYHGSYFGSPMWPTDHLLNGPTYEPLLRQMGQRFVEEFVSE